MLSPPPQVSPPSASSRRSGKRPSHLSNRRSNPIQRRLLTSSPAPRSRMTPFSGLRDVARSLLTSSTLAASRRPGHSFVLRSSFNYSLFRLTSSSLARVGQARLELATPRLSSACSNQLSYWPVGLIGLSRPNSKPSPARRQGKRECSSSRSARAGSCSRLTGIVQARGPN